MSQTTETTTTDVKSTVKGVKTAPKKSVKAVPPKTTEVKGKTPPNAEVKAAPKTEKVPAVKKTASGLKKPQERILKFLESQSEGMSRAAISEFAPVDTAACVEYIGSHIEEKRLANDTKHFPSLISLGLVKFAMPEEGARGVVYSITAKGKQLAAKIVIE